MFSDEEFKKSLEGFNPYFTGLSILIFTKWSGTKMLRSSFNPYFTGLSILIGIPSTPSKTSSK